ncbi:MAG TPA: cation:proton antiporter [Gammaproteobacteria bacterium]|nr:cation:proton antiporter [Gammaproteobacteria bacterium]
MQIATFLQDLAVIMIVAGVVTVVFHQLNQPVVLGYILSGVILGRHTPPFSFIQDESTVRTLAELGVIFLMFSMGLEFSIRKLLRVGMAATTTAVAEIISMILLGYAIGQFFGWKPMDSLFLGAMLAISSTTIIIKALNKPGIRHEKYVQLIFGILIVEDILAIGILAMLSSVATGGSADMTSIMTTLGKLFVFFVASLVIGIFFVPKLLDYVARFKSREMLLVFVLGLCFGFSLLVIQLEYSVALGAFLMGAIMAESHEITLIKKLTAPLTDMFSAIFFVSIGLLVDPAIIHRHLFSIILITVFLVIGKVIVCTLGAFFSGRDARTSMRVGMSLAQIGEFSFIIAALGVSLHVMSPYLYPVIVAISVITTFLTPYLMKLADPFTNFLAKTTPPGLVRIFNGYTLWLDSIRVEHQQAFLRKVIKKGLLQVMVNLILVMAIFIVGSFYAHNMRFRGMLSRDIRIEHAIIWGASLILSLPFLIAIYRKIKGLSLLIAEMTIRSDESGKYMSGLRRLIAEVIPIASMLGVVIMIIALSAGILPPLGLLIFVLIIVIALAAILWPWFVKLNARLQIIFMDSLRKKDKLP